MKIHIHVACDDQDYRLVIADFLQHQNDMEVVSASSEGIGAAAVDLLHPDVVVLGTPPDGDVLQHAPKYLQIIAQGTAVVAFCATNLQAANYRALGIERVVSGDDPARMLGEAVRGAYGNAGAAEHGGRQLAS
jgi:DNA-binding NarL/FixJ family response regulator